jgi:hypothetical protein
MPPSRKTYRHWPWLELSLVSALTILFFVLFPAQLLPIIASVSPQSWSVSKGLLVNCVILSLLLAFRFSGHLVRALQRNRQHFMARRMKLLKMADLKERRKAIERIKQSRSQRLY